jgi:uncharacterized protein YjiS (DUF1127 family)
MSSYDLVASSGKGARQATPTRVIRVAADLYRAWKNRRAFYRLGELSDAELADIGLTRTDLHVAVTAPFASDPTVRLRAIADERVSSVEDCARRVA